MLKRMLIIYNPVAGQRKFHKLMPVAEQILDEAGFDVTLIPTTEEEKSATAIAKQGVLDGFEIIIAAGGDGTVNDVVNGLMQASKQVVFGVLPVGTTNDFARALGMAKDPIEALQIIAAGEKIKVDVGQANGQYFINNAAGGKITEITYAVKESMKNKIGRLAYLVSGISLLPKLAPKQVRITYDTGVFEGEILLLFGALTNSVGGMEKLCPPAILNDGYMDLLVLKKVSPIKLLKLLASIKSGAHLQSEDVLYVKTKTATIECDTSLNISYDGVYGGETPYKLAVLPEKLTILAEATRIQHRLQK
ncbi:lipid kinase [Listeria weihenstephanensis FSL R9-0317]|uniref:Diacylglycerol kinase n=1 Tax=Listeria weihenstephanensis TaxID=1006155 RepID=A0A1S7FRK7_9LIST|nr:diacylglycerol kinase [Listeria weihenstephanensis]AQY49999.1 lipid kinase [Listeria weihenstephanensis]EUJ39644.1 lipid kinase [Listeria weihenstephanensis FSL R9-0317]MBC1502182.1 diacylglycerol kinase [Listeria weihenstephanensis]